MKTRKTLRTLSAIAAAFACTAVSAAAVSADVVDFENGDFSFVSVRTDDGGDLSVISVEDFNGSKQLKVDVQDCSLLPKIVFDVNALAGTDNLSDIDRIEMELTFASKDGTTAPGWIGGCIGTTGSNDTPAWDQSDFEGGEYEKAVSEVIVAERKFLLPAKKFVSGTEGSVIQLMRWGCEVPYYMYVDNIRFLDKDGNELALALTSAAPAAETEAAPADEPTDVPASDSSSVTPTTGNSSAAAIVSLLAVSAAAAIITGKRRK